MTVLHMDCVMGMRGFPTASFDSIVCDPPYELTNGKKGGTGIASVNLNTPHGRARISTGGFMGAQWDATGIAHSVEMWTEALRVLKPGGYMLAFAGSRTYHRMTCAIEDAGFEIRDQIMWLYGSGFPKSHNGPWGGTALKPAHEPICVARKPLVGTVAANVLAHGTGALNIDACRIEPTGESRERVGESSQDRRYTENGGTNFAATPGVRGGDPSGRWPANIIHDGSDEVLAAFPSAPGALAPVTGKEPSASTGGTYGKFDRRAPSPGRRETDKSAARFFYCAKANKADRDEGNIHPTVKPRMLIQYLCRLVTPPGGVILDPFSGSGTTGVAAKLEGFHFIGFELDAQYAEIANRRIENTVKPT